jgi:hypothetical protein
LIVRALSKVRQERQLLEELIRATGAATAAIPVRLLHMIRMVQAVPAGVARADIPGLVDRVATLVMDMVDMVPAQRVLLVPVAAAAGQGVADMVQQAAAG